MSANLHGAAPVLARPRPQGWEEAGKWRCAEQLGQRITAVTVTVAVIVIVMMHNGFL